MKSVPFKLVLKLATPMIMDYPVTLDALLTQALLNSDDITLEQAEALVPLAKKNGVFKASSVFCESTYKVVSLTKIMRLTHEDKEPHNYAPNFGRKKDSYGFIDNARGQYKTNMTVYKAKDASEVYFWGVGDPDKVVFLLKTYIQCLGKRFNSGQGEIIDIQYYELDHDFSWETEEGNPARPLPVELWQGKETPCNKQTVKYPYWSDAKVNAVFPTAWVI